MPYLPFPKKAPPKPGWERGTKRKFYQTQRWRDLRAIHVSEFPICAVCLEIGGRPGKGCEVDHIIRIENGGAELDQRNLWTLCRTHHARKTAMERHGLILGSVGEHGSKLPTHQAIEQIKNALK